MPRVSVDVQKRIPVMESVYCQNDNRLTAAIQTLPENDKGILAFACFVLMEFVVYEDSIPKKHQPRYVTDFQYTDFSI